MLANWKPWSEWISTLCLAFPFHTDDVAWSIVGQEPGTLHHPGVVAA